MQDKTGKNIVIGNKLFENNIASFQLS